MNREKSIRPRYQRHYSITFQTVLLKFTFLRNASGCVKKLVSFTLSRKDEWIDLALECGLRLMRFLMAFLADLLDSYPVRGYKISVTKFERNIWLWL
jgi:hypothetical protein